MSKTATKLPSQVQKISDTAEAIAKETGMKTGSKPETPASAQLAVVDDPAKGSKIDQEDYKQRYVNYKKATDVTISELRSTLATTQATLAETQRQVQGLMNAGNKPAVTDTPATVDTSSELTKESPVYKEYLAKLPKSITDEYTEDYLFDQFVIQTSMNGYTQGESSDLSALEAKVDGVVQFQEKTKGELYEEEMDIAFPNDEWIILASGEEWNQFCKQRVSEIDSRTFGQVAKQGNETKIAAEVIWVLNQYKTHLSTLETANTAVVDPLLNQLTPEGGGAGGGDPITELNAQAETFTSSQVTQFFTDCATTDKYTAEEAAAIEKSIMAAQVADKIIAG